MKTTVRCPKIDSPPSGKTVLSSSMNRHITFKTKSMSKSKEYKAIKNYIHNELGLSKQDIINEIRPLLPKLLKEYMNNSFGVDSHIENWIKFIFRDEVAQLEHNYITRLIKEVIADEVKKRLEISVKTKEND